jgi:hypothetical protein
MWVIDIISKKLSDRVLSGWLLSLRNSVDSELDCIGEDGTLKIASERSAA